MPHAGNDFFLCGIRHFLPRFMFQFKQFSIQQDRTPMKVGTDGVLLGAWTDLEKATRILDIGTGTGLIALMSAQRNATAHIDALEIDPDAIGQARENVAASPWADRINIIPLSLQQYDSPVPYDCIVCNPPYFTQSTKTPHPGRTLARHNDTLPHRELIEHSKRLLSPEGNFQVILPVPEAMQLIEYARASRLYPVRITKVLPNPGKPPKRYLIKFSATLQEYSEDELIIEYKRHLYSPEYVRLTKSFYLNFN